MTEEVMKVRLEDIFTSCNIAIEESNALIDEYYSKVWNSNREKHHKLWQNTENKGIMTWLYPDNKALKKNYDHEGRIHEDHLTELKNENWNKKKIFEHLEDIHERLIRIREGFKVIQEWMQGRDQQTEAFNTTNQLFSSADANIEDVICQIEAFFCQVSSNGERPVKDTILPPLRVDDENTQLEHWFVYREYEHVMKYAKELISIIQQHRSSE